MGIKLTPEFAIKYTRWSTGIIFSWPLSANASYLKIISFQIGWWISWSVTVFLMMPILLTCYLKRDNFMEFTKIICIFVCVLQVFIKMILCRMHYYHFQMEAFVKSADSYERQVLTDYVEIVAPNHKRYNCVSLTAAIAIVLGPLATDQPFPTVAEYPFAVDENPMYDIIYFLESVGTLQCMFTGGLDCQICLLLWYATTRLQLLAERLRNVTSIHQLNECIKLHQYLLRYIEETIEASRGIIATTLIFATVSIVCGSVHIVGNLPAEEKVQFIGIYFGYILELLSVAWAVENMAAGIGWAVYESAWIKNSKECNKTAIFIMQRSEKIPKFEIGGLLPELSLAYYATYISKTFSFFTTLHVILEKFEDVA